MAEITSGDTAWILMSAALVMLMTPGLALFYGAETASAGPRPMRRASGHGGASSCHDGEAR